jgi:hypothetical protein
MQSIITFFKNGQEIGKGRWDGRANAKTAPINVNWDYPVLDFDIAICKTKGGKVLIIKKEKNYERK